MNKLWVPRPGLPEKEAVVELRKWFMIAHVVRIALLIIFGTVLVVSFFTSSWVVLFVNIVVGLILFSFLTKTISDINLCYQDVVVYHGHPKFRH